jgi:hypothetical protein
MKNLYKALAAFQQEVPIIHKDTKGYGYTYADLPQIFSTINPLLKKHGLGFSQLVGKEFITTIIFHYDSGEELNVDTYIPQDVKLKGMNDFQVLGSAITYLRRYALSAILGLVTDKDNDASGQQVNKEITNEQKNLILTLLETCTLNDNDYDMILHNHINYSYEKAEKCIIGLKNNQKDGNLGTQKEINKQLDSIMDKQKD